MSGQNSATFKLAYEFALIYIDMDQKRWDSINGNFFQLFTISLSLFAAVFLGVKGLEMKIDDYWYIASSILLLCNVILCLAGRFGFKFQHIDLNTVYKSRYSDEGSFKDAVINEVSKNMKANGNSNGKRVIIYYIMGGTIILQILLLPAILWFER